jgi:hypothetical protein
MLKRNDKYSNKQLRFVNGVNPNIKLNDENIHNTKSLSTSTTLNKIFNACTGAINDTEKEKHKIKLLDSAKIKACHGKNEPPLSYILFKNLDEMKILDKIIRSTDMDSNANTDIDQRLPSVDLTNLESFINWHRENANTIDFEKLHSMMKSHDFNELNNVDELVNVYKLLFRTSGKRKFLHDAIYDNGFVSLDVQYDMEICDLEYKHYKIDDKHDVKIFVPITNINDELIDEPNIHIIATLIDIMARIKNDHSVGVNLVVAYSSQKKNIYPGTKVLCCDNINSGSTYPGTSITCWRKEEFYKVFLHELVHYYNIDFHYGDKVYNDVLEILKIPEVKGRDMLNESYTETLTILIMIVFLQLQQLQQLQQKRQKQIQQNNSDTNILWPGLELSKGYLRSIEKDIILAIKTEVAFIMFQIAKILTIFGANTFDDYVTKKVVISQNTSFRSYFIIKCSLLLNLANTLRFMDEDINVHDKRIIDFGHVINKSWESLLNDETNIKIINDFMKKIKDVYKQNKSDELKWIYRTCRMSVNGPR